MLYTHENRVEENKINEKTKQSYPQALQGKHLDTSDVILLSIALLKDALIEQNKLATIQQLYLQSRIEEIKPMLIEVAEESLAQLIAKAFENASANDQPEACASRRYYEANMSKNMWDSLTETDLEAMDSFLETIKHVDSLERDGTKRLKTKLPQSVNDIFEAETAISVIRELGEGNQSMLDVIIPLRNSSAVANSKDRGTQKNVADKQLSLNPGIIKASAPLFVDQRLSETAANKLPDTFYIKRDVVNGYSATNKHVPFVNSISGTAYSFVATLKFHLERNKDKKDKEALNEQANAITRAWVAFTAMKGYHSFGEMIEVLNDPKVVELLDVYGVKLDTNLTSPKVNNVFDMAAYYSNLLLKQKDVRHVLETVHKEKLNDGWKLDPIDPVEYLKKVKDPHAIILIDTPHTILQNSFYSQREVGEICELVGNYNLMANVIFSPERLALFHTTAFVETELQRDPEAEESDKRPEDDLHNMVLKEFYPQVMKELNSVTGQAMINACHDNIISYVDNFFRNHSSGMHTPAFMSSSTDPLYKECVQLCNNAWNKYNKGELSLRQYQKSAALNEVLVKAIYTKVYNKFMNDKIGEIVDRVGNNVIEVKNLPRMQIPASPEDRHTFMVAGAPACGKGIAVGKASVMAKKNDIEWRDVCKINTDDHRSIVSDGMPLGQDARNHAQLNNLEAMMISGIAANRYDKKMQEGQAPHLLLDTVNPTMRKIDLGLAKNGQMHILVVSAPVGVSVNRMIRRGQQNNRYVGSEYLISSHKSVSEEFIQNITELARTNKQVDFLVLDTDVPFGTDPKTVMYGDTGLKEVVIVSKKAADFFYGKRNINKTQRNEGALYTELDPKSPKQLKPISKFDDGYEKRLLDAGFTVQNQDEVNKAETKAKAKASSEKKGVDDWSVPYSTSDQDGIFFMRKPFNNTLNQSADHQTATRKKRVKIAT